MTYTLETFLKLKSQYVGTLHLTVTSALLINALFSLYKSTLDNDTGHKYRALSNCLQLTMFSEDTLSELRELIDIALKVMEQEDADRQ
jgi:hypothetical protein